MHVLRVLEALDTNKTIFDKLSSGLIIGCKKICIYSLCYPARTDFLN